MITKLRLWRIEKESGLTMACTRSAMKRPLADLDVRRTSLTAEINTPGRKAAGTEGKNPSRLNLNNG